MNRSDIGKSFLRIRAITKTRSLASKLDIKAKRSSKRRAK